MKKILFLLGTRPEAIKLAPLIRVFKNDVAYKTKVCVTTQHKEMLAQVLKFFFIKPDFDLNIMTQNQSLFTLSSNILKKLESVINKAKPDLIFIQGDTTTAFISALVGFYKRIKIAHIEAGLRTFDKFAPFPEEINRRLISDMADFHFAPTKNAAKNLRKEGIKENVFVVGNTVVDSLNWGLKLIANNEEKIREYFRFLNFNKKLILVTGHRRESFGERFKNICYALKKIAIKYKDIIEIVYPVHLNPNVQKPVIRILGKIDNIFLIKPLSYENFLYLMKKAYFVVTDSGGIQEEAPSLGKPVLVIRDVTERLEGLETGNSKLIGTDEQGIFSAIEEILTEKRAYNKMAKIRNPYGNGNVSERIKRIIDKWKK